VTIRPLEPRDQAAASALIESGLRERFQPYIAAYNPDLERLAEAHLVFLVGELEGRVVTTGGLIVEDAQTARVRRMSVAADLRGRGFGARMLEALIEEARARGFRRAVLLTGEDWHSAIRLYERAGFTRTGTVTDASSGFVGASFALDLEPRELQALER
jgi:GNAT superfamily N-acetyltransferase